MFNSTSAQAQVAGSLAGQGRDVVAEVNALAKRSRKASKQLRLATTEQKNALLRAIADQLRSEVDPILAGNGLDMQRGREKEMTPALLDRLELNPERIESIASAVEDVAALPDPVGQIVEGRTTAGGLQLVKKRVPLGVVAMIYEARPNVTVDAAVLALKSGNAALLRGGSAALKSNLALVGAIRRAIEASGFDPDLVISVDEYGRDGSVALMRARGLVDVVIPRGGAGLIRAVVEQATVPTIETGTGNCHVYVDAAADLEKATRIVLNSKTHRPGVCNAAETLLVNSEVANEFLPQMGQALKDAGVTMHADSRAKELIGEGAVDATDEDWDTEYLSLDLAVKVVDSIDEAIEHIGEHSTGHTEAIVSQDLAAVNRFSSEIDTAVVMVNASTRFTDGGQFGLGAEIGISTQKLHARGPMGLTELTTTTWIVNGDGHVRS